MVEFVLNCSFLVKTKTNQKLSFLPLNSRNTYFFLGWEREREAERENVLVVFRSYWVAFGKWHPKENCEAVYNITMISTFQEIKFDHILGQINS